uniref:Epstein-Barr virus induced 3 n=1 Tax=Salvator merianae TaxID=96440 RepID=A0A8D0DR18_SALMN
MAWTLVLIVVLSSGAASHEGTTWLNETGAPPEKPVVWCRSATYPVINCSWKLEKETHLGTSFLSTYRVGAEGEAHECVQQSSGGNSCSITKIQMFSSDPYVLNVTAVNALGSATTLLFVFQDQILKPDSPEALKVSPIPGEPRKLLLEWRPPRSWLFLKYFPLKYLIRYSKEKGSAVHMAGPSEKTSFVLTGIRPRVRYRIQVAAKDFLDNGEYSDWSLAKFGTAWGPE